MRTERLRRCPTCPEKGCGGNHPSHRPGLMGEASRVAERFTYPASPGCRIYWFVSSPLAENRPVPDSRREGTPAGPPESKSTVRRWLPGSAVRRFQTPNPRVERPAASTPRGGSQLAAVPQIRAAAHTSKFSNDSIAWRWFSLRSQTAISRQQSLDRRCRHLDFAADFESSARMIHAARQILFLDTSGSSFQEGGGHGCSDSRRRCYTA